MQLNAPPVNACAPCSRRPLPRALTSPPNARTAGWLASWLCSFLSPHLERPSEVELAESAAADGGVEEGHGHASGAEAKVGGDAVVFGELEDEAREGTSRCRARCPRS